MKRTKRKAFTLVEITISVGLLALLSGLLLRGLISSKKQTEFTAEFFTSFFLAQKVTEDLSAENTQNPRAFSTLGLTANSVDSAVINGESVFFSNLENKSSSARQTDTTKAGTINPSMQPLYTQVEKFRLTVEAKRKAPRSSSDEKRHLVESNITFSWPTNTGQGRYTSSCIFFSPAAAMPVEAKLAFDKTAAEAEFCKVFLHQPPQPLSRIAAATRADLEAIQHLARLQFLTRRFLASPELIRSLSGLKMLQAVFNSTATPLATRFKKGWKSAKDWHAIALAAFLVLKETEPDLAYCQSKWTQSSLGSRVFANRGALLRTLLNYKKTEKLFTVGITESAKVLQSLLKPNMLSLKGTRWEYKILNRLRDDFRVMAVCPQFPRGKEKYRSFLRGLKKRSEKRDQVLLRFATQELSISGDNDKIQEMFPSLAPIGNLCSAKLPEHSSFIAAEVQSPVTATTVACSHTGITHLPSSHVAVPSLADHPSSQLPVNPLPSSNTEVTSPVRPQITPPVDANPTPLSPNAEPSSSFPNEQSHHYSDALPHSETLIHHESSR